MPIKLGAENIKLPFTKAYLGSVLKYQKSGGYVDTAFTACLFPTSWTEVTANIEYTANNDYGAWRIWADTCYNANYKLTNAFDGDTTSTTTAKSYRTVQLANNDEVTYMGVDLPSDVLINPTQILIAYRYAGNTSNLATVEALNENGEWEKLLELSTGTSIKNETLNVTTNNFYSKFRLKLHRYNSSYKNPIIYEFQIISGTIRQVM